MNVDDMIVSAMKAIAVLELDSTQNCYIEGVLQVSLRMMDLAFDVRDAVLNNDIEALSAERDRLLVAYNSVSSELQEAKHELNRMQDAINTVTRERDALRNQTHAMLNETPARIHYAASAGHIEA